MDRRTIIAIALSLLLIMIYSKFITPARKAGSDTGTPGRERTAAETAVPHPAQKPTPEEGVLAVENEAQAGKLSTVKTDTMEISFRSKGGCINEAVLKKSQIIKKCPVTVIYPLATDMQPIATSIGDSVNIGYESEFAPGMNTGDRDLTFVGNFGQLTVSKSYQLYNEGFTIKSSIGLSNKGPEELHIADGLKISAGVVAGLTEYEKNSYIGIDTLNEKGKVTRVAGRKVGKSKFFEGNIKWLALRNQFFAIVIKPGVEVAGYSAQEVKLDNGLSGVHAVIHTGAMTIKPGQTVNIPLEIYVGPKEYRALERFGAAGVIDFGWFGFLGKWILLGLNELYKLCGNYGVAIILLTIVIRLILYPLNQKSFRSMKEMQKLQPKIAALQDKYKADPKKKQEEMMKIYREHGVNPAGGCLPMILQFPILIAFFRVLQNAIELWGAPFIFWIKDLSEPDAIMRINTGSFTVPMLGKVVNGQPFILLNVLPILMLIVFYAQQKMTPTAGMGVSPEQQQQQKLMSYVMPVMFGVIFYNMPAGLNLYFTVSTLLGIIQQKYLIK